MSESDKKLRLSYVKRFPSTLECLSFMTDVLDNTDDEKFKDLLYRLFPELVPKDEEIVCDELFLTTVLLLDDKIKQN